MPAGKRLLPQDTGLAASVGIGTMPVYRRVRLGLFFTGDELVMPGEPLAPGRIYNSNRFTLNGMAHAFGCDVRDYGIVPDSLDATRAMLRGNCPRADHRSTWNTSVSFAGPASTIQPSGVFETRPPSQ